MKKCPNCRKSNWVEFSRWEKREVHLYWDGQSESPDGPEEIKEPKIGKCFDCGFKIRISEVGV